MRSKFGGLSLGLAAVVLAGCSDKKAPAAAAESPASNKACLMPSGGADVLRVSVPADARIATADGSLRIAPLHGNGVEFWLVKGPRSVDDAVGQAGSQIVDEFKDFTATGTTDLMVAGAPAKRLVGTGHEADDGDDGRADVIVFTVGGKLFVACYHGEPQEVTPAGRAELLAIVQSAQKP